MSLAWTEEVRNNRKWGGEAFRPSMLHHQTARGQRITCVSTWLPVMREGACLRRQSRSREGESESPCRSKTESQTRNPQLACLDLNMDSVPSEQEYDGNGFRSVPSIAFCMCWCTSSINRKGIWDALEVTTKELPSMRTKLIGKQPGLFTDAAKNRRWSRVGVSMFCMWEEGRSFAANRQAMLRFENTSMNSSPSSFCPHQRSSPPPAVDSD